MKKHLARGGLFLAALIWGSGYVVSAWALDYFKPFQVMALRFTIAFLVLILVNYKNLKDFKASHIGKGCVIGIFLFLAFSSQLVGLKYTTVSKNAFLTSANVVIVPLLSYLIYRNNIGKDSIVGALVTLAGIGLLSLKGEEGGLNIGDLLTLACAFFFAFHVLYTEKYLQDVSGRELIVAQMGTAALLSWLSVMFLRQNEFQFSRASTGIIVYMGLITTLLTYLIQTLCQRYTSASETAIILSSESMFGMISSVILLNEAVTPFMVMGSLLILLGILTVELKPLDKMQNRRIYLET